MSSLQVRKAIRENVAELNRTEFSVQWTEVFTEGTGPGDPSVGGAFCHMTIHTSLNLETGMGNMNSFLPPVQDGHCDAC